MMHFLDALNHVQQLNGFVPTPTLLNSPSFLAPLIQSVSSSTSNEQSKTVTSPVLTSPTRFPYKKSFFDYITIRWQAQVKSPIKVVIIHYKIFLQLKLFSNYVFCVFFSCRTVTEWLSCRTTDLSRRYCRRLTKV